jgi:maltose O-acetyltransferase
LKRILKSCGKNVVFKNKCYCGDGSKLEIGDESKLDLNSRITCPVRLGRHVMMGPDIVIMGVTHGVSDQNKPMIDPSNPSVEKLVTIGNNVWIGTRVIILPGVSIGDNSIIGSGAVVTKSFPNNSIIGRVPVKLLKQRV